MQTPSDAIVRQFDAVMRKCEPPPPPPPVPPRRRRRKFVNNVDTPKEVDDTNLVKRVERKRLPPPAPPSQIPRRNKTRHLQDNQIQTKITVHVSSSKDQKDESNEFVRLADSRNATVQTFETREVDQKADEFIVEEKRDELFVRSPGYERKKEDSPDWIKINSNNSYLEDIDEGPAKSRFEERIDESFVHSPRYDRPVTKQEFNKYPPLFFTIDDIQNVIPDELSSDVKSMDSNVANEELECSLEKDQIETSLKRKESFVDNCIDSENDVCFRVTPTNFPFEKCLDRWKTSLDNDHFGIDEKNNFIFENYLDRSSAINVRRSKSPMCYDVFEGDETTVEHTATKVRFVIESPTSSISDIDIQGSLQNVDSITNEEEDQQGNQVLASSIEDDRKSSDVDIFGEIPFGSVIESNVNPERQESSAGIPVKGEGSKEEENEEEENEEEEEKEKDEIRANSADSSILPSDEDHFPKEQVPSNAVTECNNGRAEKLSPEHELSKTVEPFFVDEDLVFPEDLNESSNSRKQFNISERRKLFVTQSLRSIVDNVSGEDWEENQSRTHKTIDEDFSDKSKITEEERSNGTIRDEEDQHEEASWSASRFEEPSEEATTLTGKEFEVPVSVRRNSFLERMLSEDCPDKSWNLGQCEVVAIYPKDDRLNAIEEKVEKDADGVSSDVVDVKTDVLRELLGNFATIKLKSIGECEEIPEDPKNDETINETTKGIDEKDTKRITANEMAVLRIQAEINVSEKLNEDIKSLKSLMTDSKDGKRLENRSKSIETSWSIVEETKAANLDDPVSEIKTEIRDSRDSMEVDEKTGVSDANCAIVREKTPNVITHCNNDDNNRAVRTPVDLSNDQSSRQESPTIIIPGSVRSFVKYYEIRRETTAVEDSKINDRRTLDRRTNLVKSEVGQDSVSKRIRIFECMEESETERREEEDGNVESTSRNDKKELPTNPESVSNEISYTMIVKKIVEPAGLKTECAKGSPGSPNGFVDCYLDSVTEETIKNDRKKSVQFSGGHTVIRSEEVYHENTEENFEDSFSRAEHQLAQELPRTDYERDSGINRFASNAASNARLVFYCTV